jgi:hypothetical protein
MEKRERKEAYARFPGMTACLRVVDRNISAYKQQILNGLVDDLRLTRS